MAARNVSLLSLSNFASRIITEISAKRTLLTYGHRGNSSDVYVSPAEICRSTKKKKKNYRQNDYEEKNTNYHRYYCRGGRTVDGKKAMLALSVTGMLQYFRIQDKDETDPFEELEKCQRYIEDGNIITAENILKHTLIRTKNDHVTIKSKELLADIAAERRQYDKAEQLIRENLDEMSRRGLDKENPKFVRSQLKLAKILEHRYHDRDAENIYHLYNADVSSKIQFAKEQNNEDGLTVWLEFTIQYSEYQCKMKYFEEALGSLHKSYDICVHLYGENCRQLVHILSSLGRINFMRNDFEQSSKYLQKAYEIGQRYPDVKEMSVVYTYLGNLSLKRGLLTEAKNYCDTALDYATRHMVSDHISEASVCLMNVTNAMQ